MIFELFQVSFSFRMPAKRKDVLIGKQKRLIATRLMQISLLIDDYVYHQKPMSQRSLTAYIREVSAYKEKCYKDARSLQVIEKLTRCLNGIILEQQELNGEGIEDELVLPFQEIPKDAERMLSPVYSTADEDLTQITSLEINDDLVPIEQMQDKTTVSNKNVFAFQEMQKDNIKQPIFTPGYSTADDDLTKIMSLEINNNLVPIEQMPDKTIDFNEKKDEIETQDVCTTEKLLLNREIEETGTDFNQLSRHINKPQGLNAEYPTNIEVIDLFIDQILGQNNALNITYEPELNIQNAISHLSIRDFEEPFTQYSQDCSQSILDSFIPTDACNNANYVRKDLALTQNVTRATIVHQEPATKIVTNNKIVNGLSTTKQKLKVRAPVRNESKIIQSTQNMRTTPKDTQKTKASKKKPTKRNVKNKNNTKLSSNISNAVTQVKDINIKQKQSVKANDTKPSHEAVKITYANETQTKHSDYIYKAYSTKPPLTYSRTLPTFSIEKPNSDKINIKAILPIYNKKAINDLSWIENIRFVREISSKEYEPFTGDEDFWKTCTLPYNNIDDFNY